MRTPAETTLRILHLSDTHLYGDGTLHYGIVDTTAALARTLERASELEAVDVVVASGDLSDDGSAESYRILAGMLEPWAAERGAVVVYAMGNHDLRAGFEEVLGARTRVHDIRGFRIATIDSTVPGAGYGNLDEAQLDALRVALEAPSKRGAIVVIHHPPVPAQTTLLGALELQNPADLLDVCATGDVRLILAGHYHHPLTSEAAGVPVIVAPAVANTADPLALPGTERAAVGSGFAYIELVGDRAARVMFITAPGPDDGDIIYDLDAAAVDRIASAAGPR
ncbi:MAG TPA: metallophosphoesterase [Diaminobutyricibacter sp.]